MGKVGPRLNLPLSKLMFMVFDINLTEEFESVLQLIIYLMNSLDENDRHPNTV